MWTGKDQHISVPRCIHGLVLFLSKRLRFAQSMDVVQVVGDGWDKGIPRHRLRQGVGWRVHVCVGQSPASERCRIGYFLFGKPGETGSSTWYLVAYEKSTFWGVQTQFPSVLVPFFACWTGEWSSENSTTELRNWHNLDWRRKWFKRYAFKWF